MMSFDFDDGFSIPKYRGLRDYHLRSALVNDNLKLESYGSHDKNIRKEISALNENFKVCDRDPCKILGRIFEASPLSTTYGQEFFYAGQSLKLESSIYSSLKMPFFLQASKMLTSSTLKSRYFVSSQFFQRAIIISNAKHSGKAIPADVTVNVVDERLGFVTQRLESLNMTLKIGSECFGVILEDKLLSIHHIDHLKNWSDKCTERFNVELACIFGNPLNPEIYPEINLMYEFWSVWDGDLRCFGNKMYKCVKIFESMVIGVILTKNENQIISPITDFLEVTIKDFISGIDIEDRNLIPSILRMRDFLFSQLSMQHLSQFYGLYRIWGHPIVDPRQGIKKVHDLGMRDKQVSDILPVQIRRIFMVRFSCWFKSARGKYPLCQDFVDGPQGNHVRTLLYEDAPISILEQTLNSPDWDSIRFRKCVEIPKTFNLSEMVADKAVTPDRNGLYNLCLKGGSLYDANLRRGVLQWLSREPESCENFLTRINDSGLEDNEMIIGLYQKEREVNATPRMFALMSHSIRNYIVTTESMISDDILPAFPNITMTNSLLSLQKKIYAVSHKQALNIKKHVHQTFQDVTIIVNIDFEKWNLNFRRETTYPLFQAMGDIYGMENLYNRTYDIFEGSLIYLAEGSYRPRINVSTGGFILEEPCMYQGHKGGFEGLRQKGWTVFTDCGLELICSRHKCSYTIMGQGDNQVLALTWRTYMLEGDRKVSQHGAQILSNQFRRFMNDLVTTFGLLGLPVKALETWTSENLFLYGKFPTLKGVPLAMSLKKICRAYYLANDEIMTLDCSLSTIQSNAMAACMSDVTSIIPYVVYKIQLYLALKAFDNYHVLLGKGAFEFKSGDSWRFTTSSGSRFTFRLDVRLSKWKFLTLLTWFPKILGGVSIATWYDFLMRGFPDKVTSSLTWVKHLIDIIGDDEMRDVLRRIYQCHINPERNFTLLIEDPCALNLVVPVDARASVKQSVQELFEGMDNVKNAEFASLFKFNSLWDKNEFCAQLCKGDILHPRFLHDVTSATLGGYVDSVVSKVSKASTITKIALRTSLRDPNKKIEGHESNYMLYLLWKAMKNQKYQSNREHVCPTEQARVLRLTSWEKILEGVTVPFPLAFLEFRDCTINPEQWDSCDKNYLSVSLPEIFASGDLTSINSLGDTPPYLGSETKEKLGGDPMRQVFGKEPLISRPINLLRVINWFVPPDSHAEELIFKLLESVSDLNPRDYVSKEMGITGSEAHRYRDQALKHGVMSANMYTLGSHMHISTDSWTKYSRGAENFTINYQGIICTIQALIGGHISNCHFNHLVPSREYHFHESCLCCIDKVSDIFHDLSSRDVVDMIPSGRGNAYLWVEESSLEYKYKNDPQLILQIPEISTEEYNLIKVKRKVLTQWVANSIADDVLKGSPSTHGPRLLDSKDYPRVMYLKLGVKELWEECARVLISRAGVKYSNSESARVAYIDMAKELAADDVMKCSSGSLMGLSMFFTWPEKFAEVYHYDSGSIFPDTYPPTISAICGASQANIRNVIRKCKIKAPKQLIIARTDKNPIIAIKCFWYRVLCSEGNPCPLCLRLISTYQLVEPLIVSRSLKCDLGHSVITPRMLNIRLLTASEDRLLKDSEKFVLKEIRVKGFSNIPTCSAVINCTSSLRQFPDDDLEADLVTRPLNNISWKYSCCAPTNSKCRVYETLSVIINSLNLSMPSNGVIFGDGLGMTSNILSGHFPNVDWIAASLQDSGNSVPQSYPHVLVPCNPIPNSNVNYLISKIKFNDLSNDKFVENWSDWILGGVCWCEIETQENRRIIFENLLDLCNWKLLIVRSDFESYREACDIISLLFSNCRSLNLYLTGSLNLEKIECIIICQDVSRTYNRDVVFSSEYFASSYRYYAEEMYHLSQSLYYAEYLSQLEDKSEVVQMIRRCDYWFAEVGITHLLSCKKLLTPVWWDLQTGKIPSRIRDLGHNKTYYLYKSDYIALQARLVSLMLSLVKSSAILNEETLHFEFWKLVINYDQGSLKFRLIRTSNQQHYGVDQLKISRFVPILRKLNNLHGRWWRFMPEVVEFHTDTNQPGFWISSLSQTLPVNLPSVL